MHAANMLHFIRKLHLTKVIRFQRMTEFGFFLYNYFFLLILQKEFLEKASIDFHEMFTLNILCLKYNCFCLDDVTSGFEKMTIL